MFTNPQPAHHHLPPQHYPDIQQPAVVAKPDQEKERDWLLDPVNLYMRGMAQKRE